MKPSVLQYAEALFEAMSRAPSQDHDVIIDNLVRIMKEQDDLEKFAQVTEAFVKINNASKNHAEGALHLAHNITPSKHMLEQLNSIAGKKIALRTEVNEQLTGGMVLRVEDILLDSSVEKELRDLKKHLTD
jgi:F0F1-type ATP synthase delta subunit